MDSTEKQVTKQSKSAWAKTDEHPDGTFEYTVTEQVPVKDHTKDIENAVMVGYNTDATVDGGVALGSDSVASTKAGKQVMTHWARNMLSPIKIMQRGTLRMLLCP